MAKLFIKCPKCKTTHFIAFLKHNQYVCSKCGYYFRLDSQTRIKYICDKGSFKELFSNLKSSDPLNFPGYREKLEKLSKDTGLNEAILTGECTIGGVRTAFGVMDPRFIMASMGSVVGEKVTRLFEYAIKEKIPVVMVISSGGARMQEGILSLMQMAKTSAAVKKHSDEGLAYFSLLVDPTTGGVTASFAMLADIIIAEKGALIGFAGPRVIQQTIGEKLPPGFQRADFLLEHGMVDLVVERKDVKRTLETLLKIHASGRGEQNGK